MSTLSWKVWVVHISANLEGEVSRLWLYRFTPSLLRVSACDSLRKPKLHSMSIPTSRRTACMIPQTFSKSRSEGSRQAATRQYEEAPWDLAR